MVFYLKYLVYFMSVYNPKSTSLVVNNFGLYGSAIFSLIVLINLFSDYKEKKNR